MQFLAKKSIFFILIFGLYACTKNAENSPVSVYCNLINEKLYSSKVKAELDNMLGAKVGGRLQRVWFLRTGLSDPSVPARTLSGFCRDFFFLLCSCRTSTTTE